ncbi:MAG: RsmB/NOP family class I SAM-dependent RNA methyltransferase [Chlamydiia bacterium]|nr:RsmB/NOP family class I SAM-dependent RNA methyltransferase [Chlamydiia bacterium]
MKPFRKTHLLKILNETDKSPFPLDAFLRDYFRTHKSIGSKDRQEICETLYGMVRWRALIDSQCSKPITWEDRLDAFLKFPVKNLQELPPHVQVSFPKFFYNKLVKAYGEDQAKELCLSSNQAAPTMVRVNTLKGTRASLYQKWKEEYTVSLCRYSENGIIFHKKINFFALQEFKEGLFEIQDEGSQLVADHLNVSFQDHVLDYCAGSGGKTLAFAPKMKNKGQIYLYDIRSHALQEAKKRLKRAGIQNAQILTKEKLQKKGMHGRMDWILLDVPCSGTGTLRRNPDMKWKLSQEMLDRLTQEQQKIFQEALKFLHPNGKIAYATCSILPEENERQVELLMQKYALKLEQPFFQSFPKDGEMDGFFCAVLSRMQK